MRISESAVTMASAGNDEELFINLRTQTRQNTGNGRPSSGTGFTVVDRVSISDSYTYQSEYAGTLNTSSTVRSADGSESAAYTHKEALKEIVGAVINREVVIGKLEKGEDVKAGPSGQSASNASGGGGDSLVTISSVNVSYEDEQVAFTSQGQVRTEDGRVIDFSMDLSMDRAELMRSESTTEIHTTQVSASLCDPLMINLKGGIPSLSDVSFEFDLDGDGDAEQINFAGRGTGFLAFDKNHDQTINDGSELFGPGTGNGFGELAAYDDDGNGWIDENDAVFSQLSVWTRDEAGNDQLISLTDAGLGAIYLGSSATEFDYKTAEDGLTGRVRETGMFLFEDGRAGVIQQIDLADLSAPPEISTGDAATVSLPSFTNVSFSPSNSALQGTTSGMLSGPSGEEESPLKTLMEQIDALKKEVQEFFEKSVGLRGPKRNHQVKPKSLLEYQLYRLNRMTSSYKASVKNWRI